MTDSDNNRTDYLYDAVGRLVGIFAPNYEYVTFRYDQGGRLTEKWFPNGVNTRYTYNADNTIQQVVNRTSASSIISQHDYTYDGVGNRQTHTEKVGSTTTPYYYAYDELNRLKEVRNTNASGALIEGYSYDPLGNRQTKTDNSANTVYYIYDTTDVTRLKEVRQGSITGAVLASMLYDDNGNMNSKTEGATTTTMLYDALNRLAQVSKTGQSTQNYQYDDQGRRIAKTIGAATTNFLYNGPDIVAEYTNWTALNAQYTHGPDTDDPIIRQAGALAQYFHQDGLGSVVGLSNNADSTTATQRFDAWGNVVASSGTVPQYGYTGREPDETGLVYYRARFYDPSIGRFTQRDPIGFEGGDINLYAYVGNDPVNFTDPEGLWVSTAVGVLNGAVSGFMTGAMDGNIKAGVIGGVAGAVIGGIVGTFAPGASGSAAAAVVRSVLVGAVGGGGGGAVGALSVNGDVKGAIGSGALFGAIAGLTSGVAGTVVKESMGAMAKTQSGKVAQTLYEGSIGRLADVVTGTVKTVNQSHSGSVSVIAPKNETARPTTQNLHGVQVVEPKPVYSGGTSSSSDHRKIK